MTESTRETLLSRVRDPGDSAAWRELDERYRDLVLRYCRRRGLQESDAEDVRQALMLNLSRAMRSFTYRPELGRFRDYLRRATAHAIARRLSRQDPARPELFDGEMDTVPDAAAAELDEIWEKEWRAHHLRQAMEKARRAFQRQTLEIFERLLAGERPDAIALARGVSVAAVYKAKERVREFLRERVREQLEEEEFPEHRRA